ncbi:hypothetical protein SH668x_003515 [Planctomicrobium sp. SH668]|uniref:hypothetical protein n=1 Tax=Planctomicrobium sp. SH668 TaxID=3448126 RepID=UPI003F5B180F
MRITTITLICLVVLSFNHVGVLAEESPKVRAAIQRGVEHLKPRLSQLSGGNLSLATLAVFKGGEPADSPEMQGALKSILTRFSTEAYLPGEGATGIYIAGVDGTLLSDIDPVLYRPELQKIADYIVHHQRPDGGWQYPGQPLRQDVFGDTSVTQYATLGLWAASRAGVKIDPQVWVKVLDWHIQCQSTDGGYAYNPPAKGAARTGSTLNMSVNGVGSLHIAILELSPGFLPLREARIKQEKPGEAEKKFGVLDELKLEDKPDPKSARVPDQAIGAVRRAYALVASKYVPINMDSGEYKTYYLYSLERMAALADVQLIGNRDWYRESSEAVLALQNTDGSWRMSGDANGRDTAFCILFLSRATAKILKRVPKENTFGDGLLAAGRGLPDDLVASRFDGRMIHGKKGETSSLDQLLASLQSTGEIPLDQTQETLVEQIQLGDRNALIGELETLQKLAVHPNPEVRRTAMWAIGRSEDLSLGRFLISGLDDPDLGVIVEARNALCWISRKPHGFGEAENPTLILPANTSAQQRSDLIAAWHRELLLNWGSWYLDVRPFDDRGDLFEANLKRRLQAIR